MNSQLSAVLSRLTPEQCQALGTEADRLISRRRLEVYRPYPKQDAFHTAGVNHRERLLLGGNRVGKTECGGAEVALHLTGRYPPWWQGRRFLGPVRWWAAGESALATRDIVQSKLVGPYAAQELWGTGMIPGDALLDTSMSRGVSDAIDTVQVRHVSGGSSFLAFKSYEQSRTKWQGEQLDGIWFDEEPPGEIYTEGVTRTHDKGGISLITATPLKGMSEVVEHFYPEPDEPHRWMVQLFIDEVGHLSPERVAEMMASWPPHEREARAKGVPLLGEGRVFPLPEQMVACEPFPVPSHWPLIGGLDFGWDHPTAAVRLAYDKDVDTVYVTHEYRRSQVTTPIHAGALLPWGDDLRWAWPHDGYQHDKQSGEPLAESFRAHKLQMLAGHATHPDGGTGFEGGLQIMLDRMETGRLKVFSTCEMWFGEFRNYHRKDGKVVKLKDDLLSATRYAIMMLREARVPGLRRVRRHARAAYSMYGD